MFKEGSEIEYELELPKDYIPVPNIMECWKLKEGSTTKTINDYEIRKDLLMYYFNPLTIEFYPIRLHQCKDTVKLEGIFKDGNLYMNKNDQIWNKK